MYAVAIYIPAEIDEQTGEKIITDYSPRITMISKGAKTKEEIEIVKNNIIDNNGFNDVNNIFVSLPQNVFVDIVQY